MLIKRLLITHSASDRSSIDVIRVLTTADFEDDLATSPAKEHLVPQTRPDRIRGLIAERGTVISETGRRKQNAGLAQRSSGQWPARG